MFERTPSTDSWDRAPKTTRGNPFASQFACRIYLYVTPIVLLVAGYFYFIHEPDYTDRYGPGVVAPDAPMQSKLDEADRFKLEGFEFEPVADFSLTARVLSRSHYSADTESQISPVDLALGWGRMSDESVLANIDISQTGRFYRWRTQRYPIPRKEIETCSANMHMIPSDDAVEHKLKAVQRGHLVSIRGMLVNVYRENGWRWLSSKSRSDTGSGACEVVYVQSIEIIPPRR